MELDTIVCADALALCHAAADAGIQADMILCDLPYGTTACAWDTVIPFEPMWEAFKRVIKPRGAIVLTASQPFTSALVMSNPHWFRYDWVWRKSSATRFQNARYMPLLAHESVLVFGDGTLTYNPQRRKRTVHSRKSNGQGIGAYGGLKRVESRGPAEDDQGLPVSVLDFNSTNHAGEEAVHPTQKHVALFEYLIRTYTQAGELVLDPCVGSGTTAIAARKCGRHFLCGDSSAEYVALANKRLAEPYTPDMFVALETAVQS